MPLDLSDTFVVGISATALFNLADADEALRDGIGMALVRALLGLNRHAPSESRPLVEVVVMSRNSPEIGVRVVNNIRSRGLPIARHAFTGGEPVVDYLDAFAVDLFLTTNVADAQRVIDAQACAAAVLKPPPQTADAPPDDQVRMAFDGDAVLFDESSELVYKTEGLDRFHTIKEEKQNEPANDGPYAILLRKLARLQERLPFGADVSPLRIAIVTARSAAAEMRVINTLRHWGVYVNQIFFLGGAPKAKAVKAFRAQLFFDDQDLHLDPAAMPSGRVPYRSDPPLFMSQPLPPEPPLLLEKLDASERARPRKAPHFHPSRVKMRRCRVHIYRFAVEKCDPYAHPPHSL